MIAPNRGWILTLLVFGLILAGCLYWLRADVTHFLDKANKRPNFLFIVSDDQSWLHTSFAGYPLVATPSFDSVAERGVYFANAYATAPTCTASRSSILAGQPIWRLGAAANLHGEYSPQMISYQTILSRAGYAVGFTGKGWEPGHVPRERLQPHLPTGQWFNKIVREADAAMDARDLAANFEKFLKRKRFGAPFSFWVGSVDPHRPFRAGVPSRFEAGDSASYLPAVMPATPLAREEFSAYLEEIESFDRDVGSLLRILKDRGLMKDTIVIITSDNGMPFPRSKSTNYDYGVRVPLAVMWESQIIAGRVVEDLVSLADIAPTLLELARVRIPGEMTGKSLTYALSSAASGIIDPARDATYSAFERHGLFVRGGTQNLTYPRRAIHTARYSYIHNYFPERWPAGDPPFVEAYPMLLRDPQTGEPLEPYYSRATARRPAAELYDRAQDPDQVNNLAADPAHADTLQTLAGRLREELLRTGDPLQISGRDVFQDFAFWAPDGQVVPTPTKPGRRAIRPVLID